MRSEDCFQLGHISRTHGYKGALVAVFDTDRPEAYFELESVLVPQHGELIPFFISRMSRNSKGHFILEFEDLSPAEAEQMVGSELWLPLSLLPPLSGKQFYFHEILGFALRQGEQHIGYCRQVLEQAAHPLLKVEGEQGEEILIPAVDAMIESIDRKGRCIYVQLPEGLLDLYRHAGDPDEKED